MIVDLGFTSTGGAGGVRPQLLRLPRTADQVDSWEAHFPLIQPCHQTYVYQKLIRCVFIIQTSGFIRHL